MESMSSPKDGPGALLVKETTFIPIEMLLICISLNKILLKHEFNERSQ